jgi:UDP-N-acetylglucosamine diphosphorylase/glucosamine-1-phosphate N-acetyltransferase
MGNIKPSSSIVNAVLDLPGNAALYVDNFLVAVKGSGAQKVSLHDVDLVHIQRPWDIFQQNGNAIALDFDLLTANRNSAPLNDTNRISAPENIFVEPGAQVDHAILNGSSGPIYIGKDATIMEGSIIRGPFALCDHATIKMAAKIYGPTTIGPHCKVGGEVNNCVFQAYSNKGHDGFLGNSVIGEWCNLGADTNSSNLKNNYGAVKVYSFESEKMEQTDIMFCGVLMGDHSKTGINTMLNTATTVGVSANIFGAGFPSKFIASYTWGGATSNDRFILNKAFEVAENMMSRRNIELTNADRSILEHLYDNLA